RRNPRPPVWGGGDVDSFVVRRLTQAEHWRLRRAGVDDPFAGSSPGDRAHRSSSVVATCRPGGLGAARSAPAPGFLPFRDGCRPPCRVTAAPAPTLRDAANRTATSARPSRPAPRAWP